MAKGITRTIDELIADLAERGGDVATYEGLRGTLPESVLRATLKQAIVDAGDNGPLYKFMQEHMNTVSAAFQALLVLRDHNERSDTQLRFNLKAENFNEFIVKSNGKRKNGEAVSA